MAYNSTLSSQIKDRIRSEMENDLKNTTTPNVNSLEGAATGKKKPTERDLRLGRFKRAVLKIDNDPMVDEYNGPKDEDYIYNIGYTQTTVPTLTATAQPEYLSKTGYYGKQGVYYIPTGVYKDHPAFADMKKNNARFSYNQGLTDTVIANNIVREDDEKWNTKREMRVLSRNFTSLSK